MARAARSGRRTWSSSERAWAWPCLLYTSCQDTAERFAQAVAELGGPEGLAHDPGKTAVVFGRLITRAMPILLELGARAARGDFPSQILAARVLRTLAEAAGRPLSDDPVPAGLEVIETAFATVLQWAVGPDWALRPASP